MKGWYNQLHLADSIEALNALDPKSAKVDLIFADPPYNIGYSYDVYKDNLDDDQYLQWSERWIGAAARVLKPTGAFWIAIGDEYVAEIKRIGDRAGLHLRNWVIWYYTFGVHCTSKFTRSHTHLLYFVKTPDEFTFNDHDIRVPSARQLVYNDGRANSSGRVPDNTWILRPQDAEGGFSPAHDTWYFARVAGTFRERAGFHGCQLPERLLERVIRACTNPKDVVLDPFAGSGSTLVVAKKLGRRWVGYDVSEQYVRHAEARIEAVQAGDPIDGPEDPLASSPRTPAFRARRRESVAEEDLIKAFRRSSQGQAVERVLADPALNVAFIEACSLLKLPGRQRDWNLALFELRDRSELAETAAEQGTPTSWEELDPFAFAAEMALAEMLRVGYPDFAHVLCDPPAAARFDDLARSLAPGFRPLDYRWAALRLCQEAPLWRASAEGARSLLEREAQRLPLVAGPSLLLRPVPGVYCLIPRGKDPRTVYVGETSNLVRRAAGLWAVRRTFDQFAPGPGEWELEVFDLDGAEPNARRGLQALLIARDKPRMNLRELAAADLPPSRGADD